MLEIKPDAPNTKLALAYLEVYRNGSPAAAKKILAGFDPKGVAVLPRWDLTMLERDYVTAEKILGELTSKDFKMDDFPKTFYQGRTALARGEVELAQGYFAAAMPAFEGRVSEDPDDPDAHVDLGLLYAYMHRKEEAIREGRRAVELGPESEDAFHGALWAANLALVYALVGEPDQAITLIERLLITPGAVGSRAPATQLNITLAELRLRWEWDSLRSNPRFQKILAGPEPATVLPESR